MTDLLNRSITPDFTGRTVEGLAYRYDAPSRVSDDHWRNSYFEEFSKGCDTRTRNAHPSFPVMVAHGALREKGAIGTVTFAHSSNERALVFTAELDDTEVVNEILDDLENWSDVSVGFNALRSAVRQSQFHGPITSRKEVRLEELSICPTGTGLVKGAEITLVRSEIEIATPRLASLNKRLRLL